MKFAGQCFCSNDEVVQPLIMWETRTKNQGTGSGAEDDQQRHFIDQLMDDAEITKEELPGAMSAREIWRQVGHGQAVKSTKDKKMKKKTKISLLIYILATEIFFLTIYNIMTVPKL